MKLAHTAARAMQSLLAVVVLTYFALLHCGCHVWVPLVTTFLLSKCVCIPPSLPPHSGERPVEQARPNSPTDEQLQLELALRISKEEADKEDRMRCVCSKRVEYVCTSEGSLGIMSHV